MRLTELYPIVDAALTASGIVHTVTHGDVYDNWNNSEIDYVAANYDIVSATVNLNTSAYILRLFVADRLTDDASNELQALDISEAAIRRTVVNLLHSVVGVTEWDNDSVLLTPFSQKFADNLAGYYTELTVIVANEITNC